MKFLLKNNLIYLGKIIDQVVTNIDIKSKDFENFNNQANMKVRDYMYTSYDAFLDNKYSVSVNQKTLDRIKNFYK